MQNDNVQSEKPAVCPECKGTGILRPKDGVVIAEVGTFCTDCDEGRRRWDATLRAVSGLDDPVAMRARL